jgi:membrane protease YdiL (CAAX protease family)
MRAETPEPTARVPGSVTAFVLLLLGLSTPFWILGAANRAQFLPGLPLSAFAAVCPGLAAAVLIGRAGGWGAVARLGASAFDIARLRPRWWLALCVGLPFAADGAALAVQRLEGAALPHLAVQLGGALGLTALFLVAAACEELGWTGFALPRLLRRAPGLVPGVWLGLVWAAWHWIPLMQAHRELSWVAWWTLGTVSARVVMTWLYIRGGRSVCGAILFHAAINLSWQLYPTHGSAYDPMLSGAAMAAIALGCAAAEFRHRTMTAEA